MRSGRKPAPHLDSWVGYRLASRKRVNSFNEPIMADQGDKREDSVPRAKDTRHERLKLALRDNLKRRKTQARERGKIEATPSHGHEGALDDDTGNENGR
jgi:hypothetical protein